MLTLLLFQTSRFPGTGTWTKPGTSSSWWSPLNHLLSFYLLMSSNSLAASSAAEAADGHLEAEMFYYSAADLEQPPFFLCYLFFLFLVRQNFLFHFSLDPQKLKYWSNNILRRSKKWRKTEAKAAARKREKKYVEAKSIGKGPKNNYQKSDHHQEQQQQQHQLLHSCFCTSWCFFCQGCFDQS